MKILLVLLAAFTVAFCYGCAEETDDILTSEPTLNTDTGDEESSVQLALTDTYDQTRNGARLILNYDQSRHAFTGTVQNVTDQTLTRVRVEVHQSNGIELGPTTPTDLRPGETLDVILPAEGTFDRWVAHPEVGSGGESSNESGGEHGGGNESGGEHGGAGEAGGEHGGAGHN